MTSRMFFIMGFLKSRLGQLLGLSIRALDLK